MDVSSDKESEGYGQKGSQEAARRVARKMMYGPAFPTSITTICSKYSTHHYVYHSLSG
jgi:hypothetical protein